MTLRLMAEFKVLAVKTNKCKDYWQKNIWESKVFKKNQWKAKLWQNEPMQVKIMTWNSVLCEFYRKKNHIKILTEKINACQKLTWRQLKTK